MKNIISSVIKEAKWINKKAINFYSQEAFDKYMKEHPEANPKNHKVLDSTKVKEKLKQVGYDHDKMLKHRDVWNNKIITRPTDRKIKEDVDNAYKKLLKKHEELSNKPEPTTDDVEFKKVIEDIIPQHKRRFHIVNDDKVDPFPQEEYKSYSGELK